jgi:hypothetical protein
MTWSQGNVRKIQNLPTLGQSTNAICLRKLRCCNQASSQPLDTFFSSSSLLNYLKPKLFYHSKDIFVLQWIFSHLLLCLKCIKTHQGWYRCLHKKTTISLCGNPHKQTTHGAIFKKLGPMSNFIFELHKGWRCIVDPLPFFMRVTSCSPKELYYKSQNTLLCFNSLSSISLRSNSTPIFCIMFHA